MGLPDPFWRMAFDEPYVSAIADLVEPSRHDVGARSFDRAP
jgi:hypothetical protein